jgi:peptide/nickel transport system substrate-binding protein
VTADDVAFSLQRAIKMNKSPAFIINQFGFNAENVESRIVATDAKTVTLTTEKPTAISFLLFCLSANIAAIVEKKTVLANEANGDLGNAWLQKNSAGSGSFLLQAWKPSESVSLTLNEHGPYKGNLKRVVVRHVVDPSSQMLMLQKGDVDIARDLTSEQLKALQSDENVVLVRKQIASLVLISLNQSNPNLAKPQVWQAVKWALDYEGMQQNIVPLTHAVHQSMEPAGFPGTVDDTPFKKDVAKAKALMAEAGLADGFDITMDHYSAQPYPDLAQAIQANLGEIGIRVKLQSAENRQVLTKMRARQHEMALSAWGTDYFDPNSNAEVFCINKDNSDGAKKKPFAWRSSFKSDDFTAKAEAARDEKDPAKRLELYAALQRDFMQNSPFAVMFQTTKTAACRKNVEGFRLGALSEGNSYLETKRREPSSQKHCRDTEQRPPDAVRPDRAHLPDRAGHAGRSGHCRRRRQCAGGRHSPCAGRDGTGSALPIQFLHYLNQLLHGDLGVSVLTKNPVAQDIARFFPATFELATAALILAVVIGVPLGVWAAVRQGSLPIRRSVSSASPAIRCRCSCCR